MSNLHNFVRPIQGVFFIEKKSRKKKVHENFKVGKISNFDTKQEPVANNPIPKRLIQPSHIHRHNLLKKPFVTT